MDSYVGEIRLFAGNYAPDNWALCNGQLLAVSEYQALFTLIGTTYGGDGVSTFGLPDLRGRIPVGQGLGPGLSARVIGQNGGTETVTVTSAQMPAHSHALLANTTTATDTTPSNSMLPGAITAPNTFYQLSTGTNPKMQTAALAAVSQSGGSQPHSNLMPSLCVSFIIALNGIFPTRN